MKTLFAILTMLLVSACTTVPTATAPTTAAPTATAPTATAPTTAQAPAQQYPAWLEMKPGYAETCIKGGGCIPMTQAELQEMATEIMHRTIQVCRRSTTI